MLILLPFVEFEGARVNTCSLSTSANIFNHSRKTCFAAQLAERTQQNGELAASGVINVSRYMSTKDKNE